MKLDMNNLSKYDLTNAKVGDKVVIGNSNSYGHSRWGFYETTIKSVSAKRGDITLANGKRYKKDGCKIGNDRWGYSYSDKFFEYTQENIKVINNYIESMNKIGYVLKCFMEIEKQRFKMLYDLPEDKIDILHKTMKEIFEVSENE